MIDFVIFSYPRTGSNHLFSKINSIPGLVGHYEVFHKNDIYLSEKTPKKSDILDTYSLEERDRDPIRFLSSLKLQHEPEEIVGFKIFPAQNDELVEVLCKKRLIKKVVLYRQNVIANYSSIRISDITRKYVTRKADKEKEPEPKVVFDPDDFENFMNNYFQWYSNVMKTISDLSDSFFFLPYEHINSAALFDGLIAWIGGRGRVQTPASDHQKSGNPDIAARFVNHSEVLSYLESKNLLAWRYDTNSDMP